MEQSGKATIIAALITVAGMIVVALITISSKPSIPPDISIDVIGTWVDANVPANVTQITKGKNGLVLSGTGVNQQLNQQYQLNGSVTLDHQDIKVNFKASFNSGLLSSGSCDGTVSGDSMRINMSCADSGAGAFTTTLLKQ